MKECFKKKRFGDDALERIKLCDGIITKYQAQGLKLTLRQLYYQLVAAALIPNTEQSYKRLGELVGDARLAGLLDWDAIEDRGRVVDSPSEWSSVASLVRAACHSYRLPRWEGQSKFVELWVEKQALAGVLEPLASEFHVSLMVNKGYSSLSAMKESAERFKAAREDEKDLILFYLGDFDPSGEDMVRDIGERLAMFGVEDLDVQKLALTMPQIRQYQPPPNPAKMTDSSAKEYVAKHGDESWEVDALPPDLLQQIIRDAIEAEVDMDLMDAIKKREESDKERLRNAAVDV